MPSEFLYNCRHCQRSFVVYAKQAGVTVSCSHCESQNTLPTLRDLRELPEYSRTEAKLIKPQRNESKSWLFVIGFLLGVLAGIAAISLNRYAKQMTSDPHLEAIVQAGRAHVQDLPSGELWELWDLMTREGLPDWGETNQVRYNKQSTYLIYISYFLIGLSTIGFTLVAISLLAGRKKTP